jgi:hypothetical protein
VGAAYTRAAVTVGGNAPLTSGSENSTTNALGMLEVKRQKRVMIATEKEPVLKGRRQASVTLIAGNIVVKN